jgi:hypothetical protein
MLRIGAHVSIADGFPAAADNEIGLGRIFVGSPWGWTVGDVEPDEADAFRESSEERDVGPWAVHGTY